MASTLSAMEQVEIISKDIHDKLSIVIEGSDLHKFLLNKKKILDESIETIINKAQINIYEYELYNTYDKLTILKNNYLMNGCSDEDNIACLEMKKQIDLNRLKLDLYNKVV